VIASERKLGEKPFYLILVLLMLKIWARSQLLDITGPLLLNWGTFKMDTTPLPQWDHFDPQDLYIQKSISFSLMYWTILMIKSVKLLGIRVAMLE
jgi:hypothetical protein